MSAQRVLPGLGFLCLGALLARAIGRVSGLEPRLVAVALGVAVADAGGVPSRLDPGRSTHGFWLGAGIVLMGASVTLDAVLEAGWLVLFVVVLVTGSTVVTVELLSRNVFDLTDRVGSLLAAGAAICGVSAVVAVAGAVRARESQVAYAAATILLFDALTIVAYPLLGELLGLSGMVFGIWAGTSMFSTGPVVAAGFAHSDAAGQWATVTKLSRNALIGIIVLGYASYYARAGEATDRSVRTLWEEFPKFVLGFVALVLLASAGVFSPAQLRSIEHGYNWLFLVAFVGLGTEIRVAELRRAGPGPALVVLVALLIAAGLSITLLTLLV
jgi:uncharacterized integral membrane protein (TIGR00698 family)